LWIKPITGANFVVLSKRGPFNDYAGSRNERNNAEKWIRAAASNAARTVKKIQMAIDNRT
jgi:hypothetical protein